MTNPQISERYTCFDTMFRRAGNTFLRSKVHIFHKIGDTVN